MLLSNYEKQYINIVEKILQKGYYDQNRTGVATYKIPHQSIQVDLEEEFPILKTKFVAFKTSVKEILWIMQKQSNIVQDLRDEGVNIWNEWEQSDGTIGHAYGYIVRKYNQIDKLIETLKTNPQDRRMIINLWDIEELPNMALQPCCFQTIWDVTDGRLNCMLIQRSADVPLGLPFNTTQYAVLVHLIAQVTGLRPGLLTHVINNCHIYENQLDGMKEQLNRINTINNAKSKKFLNGNLSDLEKECLLKYYDIKKEVKLKINPNIKNFYDFKIEDIELENYKSLGTIKMPVSI